MKLFLVTTIVPGWPSAESKRFGGLRTVAVCTSYMRAVEIVTKNEGDIFEGTYQYAVISEIEPDVLYGGPCLPPNEVWYLWCNMPSGGGKYISVSKPTDYKNVLIGL